MRHWVAEHVGDTAQAVFIGGNGFRAAAAIEELETTLDRPVLTTNQVLLWRLLAHGDATIPIAGYGQLFTHKPQPNRRARTSIHGARMADPEPAVACFGR